MANPFDQFVPPEGKAPAVATAPQPVVIKPGQSPIDAAAAAAPKGPGADDPNNPFNDTTPHPLTDDEFREGIYQRLNDGHSPAAIQQWAKDNNREILTTGKNGEAWAANVAAAAEARKNKRKGVYGRVNVLKPGEVTDAPGETLDTLAALDRHAANMAAFNFGDEAVAGAKALFQSGNLTENYLRNHRLLAARDQMDEEFHPGASQAGNVLGMGASMLMPGAVFDRAAEYVAPRVLSIASRVIKPVTEGADRAVIAGSNLATRAAVGSATGAATGAVSATGEGTPEDRFKNTRAGAEIGAAVGTAFPIVSAALGRLARPIFERLIPNSSRAMGGRMGLSQSELAGMEAEYKRQTDLGLSPTLFDVLPERARNVIGSAGRHDAARVQLQDFAHQRNVQLPERVQAQGDEVLLPKNPFDQFSPAEAAAPAAEAPPPNKFVNPTEAPPAQPGAAGNEWMGPQDGDLPAPPHVITIDPSKPKIGEDTHPLDQPWTGTPEQVQASDHQDAAVSSLENFEEGHTSGEQLHQELDKLDPAHLQHLAENGDDELSPVQYSMLQNYLHEKGITYSPHSDGLDPGPNGDYGVGNTPTDGSPQTPGVPAEQPSPVPQAQPQGPEPSMPSTDVPPQSYDPTLDRSPTRMGEALDKTRKLDLDARMAEIRHQTVPLGPDVLDVLSTEQGQDAIRAAAASEKDPVLRDQLNKLGGAVQLISKIDPKMGASVRKQIMAQVTQDAPFTINASEKISRALFDKAKTAGTPKGVLNAFGQTVRDSARTNPDFVHAMGEAAKQYKAKDALEAGEGFLSGSPEEFVPTAHGAANEPSARLHIPEDANAAKVEYSESQIHRALDEWQGSAAGRITHAVERGGALLPEDAKTLAVITRLVNTNKIGPDTLYRGVRAKNLEEVSEILNRGNKAPKSHSTSGNVAKSFAGIDPDTGAMYETNYSGRGLDLNGMKMPHGGDRGELEKEVILPPGKFVDESGKPLTPEDLRVASAKRGVGIGGIPQLRGRYQADPLLNPSVPAPSNSDLMRIGAAGALRKDAGKGPAEAKGVAEKLYDSPEQRRKTNALVGDKKATELAERMRGEVQRVYRASAQATKEGPAPDLSVNAVEAGASALYDSGFGIMRAVLRGMHRIGMREKDAQWMVENATREDKVPELITRLQKHGMNQLKARAYLAELRDAVVKYSVQQEN
jgi:hypothetical protein